MSKNGRKYAGPDGSRIPNLGEVDAIFDVDEGYRCGMKVQVAEVQRPLIAVTHLTAAGNRVVLSEDGGEVVHVKTGKRVKIHRRGGVYTLRMWIPAAPGAGNAGGGVTASGFPRPGGA